ncbi:MAG: clostripain-related cysteine peptidase [Candidatus Cryosericum sp.]|nr:clostripain-related cysteine peptidase [bacterium]
MDRGNRPVGREKHVGSGVGDVSRRGDGRGGQTGGPVGNAGGYSDRNTGGAPNQSRGPNRGFGGFPSGGGKSKAPGGCLRYFVIIAVVLIGFFFLRNFLTGGLQMADDTGFQPPASTNSPTYVDTGAHPVTTSVSTLARDKFTTLKGNGNDTATVMVYMCGTDLESKEGLATADLQEMLDAEISDRVNIIVETGGASKWQNNIISSQTNQIYRVTGQGLQPLVKNLGKKSMVSPSTLADFIQYSKANYPANRYMLVMWDHGGGSLSGYGYDQFFPNASMTLDKIGTALRSGGCRFDVVGFDACLMGTLENALVLEPYADYMIASEEVEPGGGWYYAGWLSALSRNTSIPTTDLGKVVIDDYIKASVAESSQNQATLSLVDLAELKGTVPSSFTAFATSTTGLIDTNKYQVVSDARAGAREFAVSAAINQVDLINFAENLGTSEAKAFADVLRGCIKYNRTSSNITNANGISIFFPYDKLSELTPMLQTYDEIGIDAEYSRCITSFASVAAGGQVVATGSGNLLDTLLNALSDGSQSAPSSASQSADLLQQLFNAFLSSGDYSSITGGKAGTTGWLDVNRMKASLQYYQDHQFDPSALVVTEKGGQRVLALSEEQWALVQDLEQNVFIDDGKGFIDLGLDNVFDFNDSGDLIMEYDGTWLALNGHIVSYYMTSDVRDGDTYTIRGRIPAMLNGQLVDIIVSFDNENPEGVVLGAQVKYDVTKQTGTVPRGLLTIARGDKIDYLCDYYTYAGTYSDSYYLGKQSTATGTWKIENLSVGDRKYQMTYRLTDIYDNKYWTPSISD